MSWIEKFTNISNHSLNDVDKGIRNLTPHPLGALTIRQLSTLPDPVVGLYFVFEGNDLVYVGKSSSRSFVERLPAHFDPRDDGWFNTLPRKVAKANKVALSSGHSSALEYSVVLLCIDPTEPIQRYETILRSYMQPRLNEGKLGRFNAYRAATLPYIAANAF